ncbi:MAG: murein L,D-transpeptidase [Planctomycetaceae bacterium]|nr:MAG: murein L,D-transpeptidase [Planctomycetaceae bacterium]
MAWQIALDREGYSGGIIDGKPGTKAKIAVQEFQKAAGLPVTGLLDDATRTALNVDPASASTTYTVTADDLAQVGPNPKSWVEKSKLKRLAYPSLDEALAEKFHCTRALLTQLNNGKNIAALQAGETITVPAVGTTKTPAGSKIEVNLNTKLVRVLDASNKVVALFHCSVAADKKNLPSHDGTVVVIVNNPTYSLDPVKWNLKSITEKLLIPPGPRNPVGLCWVGLSLKGYGIHGTPNPELIGKTGSHGCIRLANWDAVRLGKMVQPGTPVKFVR